MILTLYSVTRNDLDFIKYIVKISQEYARQYINLDRCRDWDNYLKDYTGREFSSYDILLTGFENLVIKKYDMYTVVEVNQNTIYGEDKLSLLCQAICFGTIDMPGYDLFDEAFNYILENLDIIYKQYLLT